MDRSPMDAMGGWTQYFMLSAYCCFLLPPLPGICQPAQHAHC